MPIGALHFDSHVDKIVHIPARLFSTHIYTSPTMVNIW